MRTGTFTSIGKTGVKMHRYEHVIVSSAHWGTIPVYIGDGCWKFIHLGRGKCSPPIDWNNDFYASYIFEDDNGEDRFSEGAYTRNLLSLMGPDLEHYDPCTDEKIHLLSAGDIGAGVLSRKRAVNIMVDSFGCHASKVLYVEVHCNAQRGGWGGANGFICFHNGKYRAMETAESMAVHYDNNSPLKSGRRLGGVKRGIFTALGVKCPALIMEMGFMTFLLPLLIK